MIRTIYIGFTQKIYPALENLKRGEIQFNIPLFANLFKMFLTNHQSITENML